MRRHFLAPRLVALGALLALGACTFGQPSPSPGASASAAGPGAVSPSLNAACRAEAERAAVVQNRGELMRLDESENRGQDSLMQNQQERGLLVVTRDRLYRQCLARGGPDGTAAPAARQVTTPR